MNDKAIDQFPNLLIGFLPHSWDM